MASAIDDRARLVAAVVAASAPGTLFSVTVNGAPVKMSRDALRDAAHHVRVASDGGISINVDAPWIELTKPGVIGH